MAKEKRGFNSKLNSKGLENSVSEDQARSMCANQGSRYMLVVEVHAGKKVVDEDGSETIQLVADIVELVPPEHEDRIRKFQRALYMERPEQIGQRTIDSISEVEPTSEQSLAEIDAVTPDYADPEKPAWDGDPDSPVEDSVTDEVGACPFPGCAYREGHDGDHEPVEEEPAEGAAAANVVQFTHQGG